MRSQIDNLMRKHQIDALFVTGSGRNNPAMVYLTGGIDVGLADLIIRSGEKGILFHSDIERDGATQSDCDLHSLAGFPVAPLLREAGGDPLLATAYRYRDQFKSIGLTSGRVAVYGRTELGRGYYILSKLSEFFPNLHFETGSSSDILNIARSVKSEDELIRIRRMGQITVEVVSELAGFLTTHPARNGCLVKPDGDPLTISDVKTRLRMLLIEKGIQEEGTIFAIGREAAVPHNEGSPNSALRLGETIIFDAFFQEAGGGYFYDFTRTWCLGYAPEPVRKIHEAVAAVHRKIATEMTAEQSFYRYQKMACLLFQELDYPTIMDTPGTRKGYVHGLGHGVGLEVHELPAANADIPENILEPGMVVTIEPGLYDPDEGWGVRVEDTYEIMPDGTAQRIAEYPWDLVLPVTGS